MINLNDYSVIIVSISGGKDSQSILGVIINQAKKQHYDGQIIAVHADTGAEWPQSLPHCNYLCNHYNIPLLVASPFRSLPDHIEHRCRMLSNQNKPGWPDSQCRYCTSDCKRSPIEKLVRNEFPAKLDQRNILSVTGERRQESPKRARLAAIEPHKRLTAGNRTVTNWRPILDWTTDDVWSHITATGLRRHIAYDLGNQRLSCAICVLASDNDIRNGANARPDLAERFLALEQESGFTFRNGKSLKDIMDKPTIQ